MINLGKFVDGLVEREQISLDQADQLLTRFSNNPRGLLAYLLTEGVVPQQELGEAWGDFIGMPYVNLTKTLFQPDVVRLLPEEFCRKNCCIPIYQMGDAVTMAMADPTDLEVMERARTVSQRYISSVFAFAGEIEDAVAIQFNTSESLNQLIGKMKIMEEFLVDSQDVSASQLQKMADNEAIVDLTQTILLWSIKERASDIHVEPSENDFRVRFRVDGVLHTRAKLVKALLRPMLARLKVLAGVDVTERRRPLDGRITLSMQNQSYDFRFSSVPTIYGEKVVLRVLGQQTETQIPDLSQLWLSKANFDKVSRVIASPSGIFFVTGPTGSGKSTMLFSLLKEMNDPGINIMTIEDPVEYRLPGVNQIQTNRVVELDFASALRSFLRQDPDIILIGEIRDAETAKIAAQAALTGHLVICTLHTNSALQAVTRLIEIGVEPFLVAPSIIGVMAQRLARKLCEGCKVETEMPPEQVARLFGEEETSSVRIYRSVGCERCSHTGYAGRLALQEMFLVNDDVRGMIARNASILEIEAYAEERGFKTMHYDGIKKVLRGLTTVEEVDRVALADRSV